MDRYDDLPGATKAICGAWFGIMTPGKGDVTFGLRESRPSDEATAALHELVKVGVVSVEPFNQYGGLVYRPLVDCNWAFKWLAANRDNPAAKVAMVTPLTSEKEGRAYQKAVLARAAITLATGKDA